MSSIEIFSKFGSLKCKPFEVNSIEESDTPIDLPIPDEEDIE